MNRLGGIMFVAVLCVTVAGCSRQESSSSRKNGKTPPTAQPAQQLKVPLEGVWDVGGRKLQIGTTYYVISIDKSTGVGSIDVEASGVFRERTFKVSGPDSIRIKGAHRGPFKGNQFSEAKRADIVQLKDPPRDLRFIRGDSSVPDTILGQKLPPKTLAAFKKLAAEKVLFLKGSSLFASLHGVIPMTRIEDSERVALPFSIDTDLDIQIPPGSTATFPSSPNPAPGTGAGLWGASVSGMVFKNPVHPTGHIRSLKIEGHAIELKSTALHDGMLSTQKFGDIEFLLRGPNNIEPRVTGKQLQQITQWLVKQR